MGHFEASIDGINSIVDVRVALREVAGLLRRLDARITKMEGD